MRAQGKHLPIQLLWEVAGLLVKHFLSCLPSGWVPLFKEMRTWGHSKFSSYCACVLCESTELVGGRNSRFLCVTPVVESFSSDRVAFRTPSSINDAAPLQKQPTALTYRLLLQKSLTSDFRPDSRCGSHQRYCKCGVWVDCKCMEYVPSGLYTKKWLRLDQTMINLTSGDLWIPLVVIQLAVTGLKKTRVRSCIC